jgi:hypothetical protein
MRVKSWIPIRIRVKKWIRISIKIEIQKPEAHKNEPWMVAVSHYFDEEQDLDPH